MQPFNSNPSSFVEPDMIDLDFSIYDTAKFCDDSEIVRLTKSEDVQNGALDADWIMKLTDPQAMLTNDECKVLYRIFCPMSPITDASTYSGQDSTTSLAYNYDHSFPHPDEFVVSDDISPFTPADQVSPDVFLPKFLQILEACNHGAYASSTSTSFDNDTWSPTSSTISSFSNSNAMDYHVDLGGLHYAVGMSPYTRQLFLEPSPLSEPGDPEHPFAVPGAESTPSVEALGATVTSPSTTTTSSYAEFSEVGVEEVSSCDGFWKDGSGRWICKVCGVVANRKSDLKRHFAKHTGKLFFCDKGCGKSYPRLDAMHRHSDLSCGKNLKRGPKPGFKRAPKPKPGSDFKS